MKILVLALVLIGATAQAKPISKREAACKGLVLEHRYLQEKYDRKDEMDYCDEHHDSDHCELMKKYRCEVPK